MPTSCNAVLDCIDRRRIEKPSPSSRAGIKRAIDAGSRALQLSSCAVFHCQIRLLKLRRDRRQNHFRNSRLHFSGSSAAVQSKLRRREPKASDLGGLGSGHGPSLSSSRGGSDARPAALGEELGRNGELVEAGEGAGLNGHGVAEDHRLGWGKNDRIGDEAGVRRGQGTR